MRHTPKKPRKATAHEVNYLPMDQDDPTFIDAGHAEYMVLQVQAATDCDAIANILATLPALALAPASASASAPGPGPGPGPGPASASASASPPALAAAMTATMAAVAAWAPPLPATYRDTQRAVDVMDMMRRRARLPPITTIAASRPRRSQPVPGSYDEDQLAIMAQRECRVSRKHRTVQDMVASGSVTVRSDGTCAICTEALADDAAVDAPCEQGHVYHPKCVRPWLIMRSNNGQPLTCPVCRGRM